MNKFIIVLFFILFHFLDSFAQIQQVWMQRYNSYNSTDDNASDMFIDSSGNVYITGWSAGVTTLKYNRDGQLVWHNLIDDLYLRPLKIALSKSGKIYVSCIIDGGWWVLIKYDSSGNFIWSKEFRNGIGSVNDPTAYLLDDDEYSYIAGTIWNSGYKKVGFVKYDSSGSLIWTKYYEYAYEGYLNSGASIVMDGYKNIYVGGYLNVRPVTICNSLIIKYNPAGEQLWSKIYDTSVYISNQLVKLICDKQNNVITGLFVTDSSSQQFRVATIKYSSDGRLVWNKHFIGPSNLDFIEDINSDIYCDIYILTQSGSNVTGGYDYSILKYDSSGNYKWERRYTSEFSNWNIPSYIFIDTLCNSYITGNTFSLKYNSFGNLLRQVNNNTWTNEYSNLGNVIKLDIFNNILILGSGYSSISNSDDILTAK